MNITINARHSELSAGSRTFIEEKLSGLQKFAGDSERPLLAVEIEESLELVRAGAKCRAEGNLTINGKTFRAEAKGETLEEAVDELRDQLAAELRHSRGKTRGLLKRGGARLKRMFQSAR